jgi:hypothetical protein
VPHSLAAVRSDCEKKLRVIKAETPELQRAVTSGRARAALLTDEPSEADSAEFLANPIERAATLSAEIARLQQSPNTDRGHVGERWRLVPVAGRDLPVRFQAPPVVAEKPNTKLPLIIAFHGAGGDEQMFTYGYPHLGEGGRAAQLAPPRTNG